MSAILKGDKPHLKPAVVLLLFRILVSVIIQACQMVYFNSLKASQKIWIKDSLNTK